MQTRTKTSVIFDFNDTLIKNSVYFREVKKNIANQILAINISNPQDAITSNSLIDIFDDFEIKNIRAGYKPGHDNFRVSLMQACFDIMKYDFFRFRLYDFIDFQIAQLANKPVELIEGAKDALEYLSHEGYRLFIVSKGNQKEQERRVKEGGIDHYFENIAFLPKKESDDYLNFVKENNIDIQNSYMIGNSPKSDINPAKTIGMSTVFIRNESTWKYEHDEILTKEPKTLIIDGLMEIKRIL